MEEKELNKKQPFYMNDSKSNILLYQTEDGQTKIEITLANDRILQYHNN